MSEIRTTHSGLISFSLGLTRILTGLLFMIVITRILDVEEFGTWTLISSLLFYGIILDTIISYWAVRETARKIDSGVFCARETSSGVLFVCCCDRSACADKLP